MRFLLDTHVFLWLIAGDERLSKDARRQIVDPANTPYLSAASIWECVIKWQLGKLVFPQPPGEYLPAQRARHMIGRLDVDEESIRELAQIPLIHRDPFDRILIAQSIAHNLTLLTSDEAVLKYQLPNIQPC
jgi:PIN domain nuclease of toxin-antitoxin system